MLGREGSSRQGKITSPRNFPAPLWRIPGIDEKEGNYRSTDPGLSGLGRLTTAPTGLMVEKKQHPALAHLLLVYFNSLSF